MLKFLRDLRIKLRRGCSKCIDSILSEGVLQDKNDAVCCSKFYLRSENSESRCDANCI